MIQSTSAQDRVATDASALVVYASTHGHTAKIAARLAGAMRTEGLLVDVRAVAEAADADLARYDVVVVAASLHREQHQREAADWVAARRDALHSRQSVFLSVSLSAAEDTSRSRAATQGCIDDFCAQTGWLPSRTERVAGCLQYREYDFATRQIMRLMMKRMGHPTDASHDWDYTDYNGVDKLGRELAALASVPACASISSP